MGGIVIDSVTLRGLQDDDFRVRAAAVVALRQLDPFQEGERLVEHLVGMLADDYPQVRVAAIRALEELCPDGAWREHLVHECHVPAGEFIMGEGEDAHLVHLDAFYVGKYPVTNLEYERYMDDIGHAVQVPEGRADHPVAGVSWYDARDYAEWAGLRLLTEAEWEKAASWEVGQEGGGRKRKYPWGDVFDGTKCNTMRAGMGDTTRVGMYSPAGDSPCGCVDMMGNVWEWTSSRYKGYPYRVDDGREDASSTAARVLRGGSFFSHTGVVSCVYRLRYDPYGRRSWYWGFRVGLSAS
jgi:formylglycine-generating enzyme required for sulfatase activity